MVLQYADDTLVILRACEDDAQCLRRILDQFAVDTGPVINFNKSMLVPMHVAAGVLEGVVGVLGYSVGVFPRPTSGCRSPRKSFSSSTFCL